MRRVTRKITGGLHRREKFLTGSILVHSPTLMDDGLFEEILKEMIEDFKKPVLLMHSDNLPTVERIPSYGKTYVLKCPELDYSD